MSIFDRIEEVERRLAEIERLLGAPKKNEWKLPQDYSPYMPVCGCTRGTVCMNTACPHRTQVTCTTEMSDKELEKLRTEGSAFVREELLRTWFNSRLEYID